jgi:Methyltransferase domain
VKETDQFVDQVRFRFLGPTKPPGKTYLRADYRLGRLGVPLGLLNTRFPENQVLITRSLWRLARVPAMSTFALAGIVNEAVRRMPSDQSYVNVGTWQGFTLFAGMLGNPTRRCVGVDNFSEHTGSQFGAVRETFLQRFEAWRSPAHEFFESDYVDYFENRHHGPIGVYLYDGEHTFENQFRALEIAEPHFACGCLICIDDAYAAEPREATESFIASRRGRYEIVLDQPVASKGHPTFWNGFLILRCTSTI